MYALPGRVLDAFSEGTNHLIQMGAMCVTRPKDILLDLWGEERLNMDDVSGAASGSAEKQSETRDNLTTAERTVYDLLGLDPVHVDDAKRDQAAGARVLYMEFMKNDSCI